VRANLTKQKKPKVLSEQQRADQKSKRAKDKELRILQQLTDVKNGVGWSSDQVLARYFDVSRQRIWIWSKEGKLPKPQKHGEATTRWKNSDLLAMEQSQ
jgi:predicted DNA-binding transcriptional regulator AlpA